MQSQQENIARKSEHVFKTIKAKFPSCNHTYVCTHVCSLKIARHALATSTLAVLVAWAYITIIGYGTQPALKMGHGRI